MLQWSNKMLKQDVDKLLTIGFIQFVKEATKLSPIVVVPKKNGKLKIYINFKKTKCNHKEGSIPITFHIWNAKHSSKVWGIFLNGYSRYH
jgi:hypothetical protein